MPKEINPRRKWKRVILCLDYICLNIYLLGEWTTENNGDLRAKTLRVVNRIGGPILALFRSLSSSLLPSPHPGDVWRRPLTLQEGRQGSRKTKFLKNVFPHVLSQHRVYKQIWVVERKAVGNKWSNIFLWGKKTKPICSGSSDNV